MSKDRTRSNPLLANSSETPMAPPPAIPIPETIQEVKVTPDQAPGSEQKVIVRGEPRKPLSLPTRPPVRRRRRKKKKFGEIYVTRSFSIDQRYVKEFDDFFSQGETITSFANQVFLDLLINAGYDLDEDLLKDTPI